MRTIRINKSGLRPHKSQALAGRGGRGGFAGAFCASDFGLGVTRGEGNGNGFVQKPDRRNRASKQRNFNRSSELTMKALIVYDDFASAAKANATLQRVGHRANMNVQWIIKPWQVNVLREEMPAETALTDSLGAHLIVFAGRSARSIPFWIKDWLERWVALREIQDAAVAVINDTYSGGFATSANSELAGLVLQHGLNFIADEDAAAKGAARLSVRFSPEQAVTLDMQGSRLAREAYGTVGS